METESREMPHVHLSLPSSQSTEQVETVFDELIAFDEVSERKPTWADAVQIAFDHKKRNAGVQGTVGVQPHE